MPRVNYRDRPRLLVTGILIDAVRGLAGLVQAGFAALPALGDEMNVRMQVVPHAAQRYDTVGDWHFTMSKARRCYRRLSQSTAYEAP